MKTYCIAKVVYMHKGGFDFSLMTHTRQSSVTKIIIACNICFVNPVHYLKKQKNSSCTSVISIAIYERPTSMNPSTSCRHTKLCFYKYINPVDDSEIKMVTVLGQTKHTHTHNSSCYLQTQNVNSHMQKFVDNRVWSIRLWPLAIRVIMRSSENSRGSHGASRYHGGWLSFWGWVVRTACVNHQTPMITWPLATCVRTPRSLLCLAPMTPTHKNCFSPFYLMLIENLYTF